MKLKQYIPIIILTLLSTGCSTMVNGTHQQLTAPNNCTIKHPTLGNISPTNGFFNVPRGKHTLELNCPPKEPVKLEPVATKEALVGAALLDFGIVDYITGAFWGWVIPEEVNEETNLSGVVDTKKENSL